MSDGDNIVWGTGRRRQHRVGHGGRRRQHRVGHRPTATTSCGAPTAAAPTATTSSGAAADGDNIVWGTASDGDNIVWGTSADGDNIVWGTSDGDTTCGALDGDDTVTFPTMTASRCRAWISSSATSCRWRRSRRASHPSSPFRSEATSHGKDALSTELAQHDCAFNRPSRSPAMQRRSPTGAGPADADRRGSHPARAASVGCGVALRAVDDRRSRALHLAAAYLRGGLRAVHRMDAPSARRSAAYACFAVTLDKTDTAIGIFQMRQLEPSFGTAEWGFAIGSAYWGSRRVPGRS